MSEKRAYRARNGCIVAAERWPAGEKQEIPYFFENWEGRGAVSTETGKPQVSRGAGGVTPCQGVASRRRAGSHRDTKCPIGGLAFPPWGTLKKGFLPVVALFLALVSVLHTWFPLFRRFLLLKAKRKRQQRQSYPQKKAFFSLARALLLFKYFKKTTL